MRKKEIFFKSISKRPPFFPFELVFFNLNFTNFKTIHNLYLFLEKNYIEDYDCYFRFNYNHEFLILALMTPRWNSIFNIGMIFSRGKKFLGSINSMFKRVIFDNYLLYTAEINFLCLMKKIRNKRFVSSLIRELTRRLNLYGISQALFTTAICFLKSFLTRRVYHYPINPRKLFNLEFTSNFCFMPNTKSIYKKFKKFATFNIKNMKWYFSSRKHLTNFGIYNYFDVDEFFHFFRTIPGVFYNFPLKRKNHKNLKIISFFSIPEKIIPKKKKKFLFPSYWYYSFFKISLKLSYQKLLESAIKLGFDLFNVIESFSEKKNLCRWNFKKGTGRIQIHIFNWKKCKIYAKNNSLTFF